VIINFGSDHDDMVGLTRGYFRCWRFISYH